MSSALVVIGDTLLDRDVDGVAERLSPDAPVPVLDERSVDSRPGGAGLAAALAAADGHDVTLVTALADDAGGRELTRLLQAHGVRVVDVGLAGATPEKVRLRAGRQPLLRLDRGGREPSAIGEPTAAARAAIGWADALLVSDYGRGITALDGLRDAISERARTGVPVVWDPHPRGAVPVPGVTLATPNAAEAAGFAAGAGTSGSAGANGGDARETSPRTRSPGGTVGDELTVVAAHAATLRERWAARAVCVTRGANGVLLDQAGPVPLVIPAHAAQGGDPCGAGDRFAASAAAGLADGCKLIEAVEAATVAAARFVAAGGAAAIGREGPDRVAVLAPGDTSDVDDALVRISATHAAGGVVVATGGCFDLLHPGHVRLLSAARALGDCLVVCINADASVRRLKGPTRPLVPASARADVLAALGCVDAVVVFEEDTPCELLERLRPDVWVKGGDYAGAPLPEAEVLQRWGGRTVLVPLHAGHSTTRLIEEAIDRAAS